MVRTEDWMTTGRMVHFFTYPVTIDNRWLLTPDRNRDNTWNVQNNTKLMDRKINSITQWIKRGSWMSFKLINCRPYLLNFTLMMALRSCLFAQISLMRIRWPYYTLICAYYAVFVPSHTIAYSRLVGTDKMVNRLRAIFSDFLNTFFILLNQSYNTNSVVKIASHMYINCILLDVDMRFRHRRDGLSPYRDNQIYIDGC